MFGRKRRNLEARVEELERRLDGRTWEPPPANHVPRPPLPTMPDYTGPGWTDDDTWHPHGYL